MKAILIEDLADLRYLTGLPLSQGTWVEAKVPTLLVDGRYFAICREKLKCAVELESPEALRKAVGDADVVFDSGISYARYLQLQKVWPGKTLTPVKGPLRERRVCKSAAELVALRKAAKLTYAGIEYLISRLRDGVSEKELAWEFEQFVRTRGASGLSFDSIVAFGEQSAYPHHRASDRKLKKGDLVLIDVGAVVEDYHGDMTRVAFWGAPNQVLQERYAQIQKVTADVIAHVKPGVKVGTLDQMARDVLGPLFIHSLGHGVGLETHEFPRLKCDGEDRAVELKEGMVFTVEPGLYEPGVGGVRFEQMVVVTSTGASLLHE